MKISTAKQYHPNWKNIFSQLQNYFFTIKYSLLANKYTKAFLSPISGFVRDLKTFLLSQISQTKTKSVY